MVGVAGKNRVFQHFLPEFCPVFCILSSCIHIIRIFWKEIGPSLLFLTVGTTNTKVRRSTGVATANSTIKYPSANELSWAINYIIIIIIMFGIIIMIVIFRSPPVDSSYPRPISNWEVIKQKIFGLFLNAADILWDKSTLLSTPGNPTKYWRSPAIQ